MLPLRKNIKRYFSLNGFNVMAGMLLIVIGIVISGFYSSREIIIVDGDKKFIVNTMKTTIAEVLQEENIEIGEYDYISFPLNAKLREMNDREIHIVRAVPVKLNVDGNEQVIMASQLNVKNMLKDNNIELSDLDRIEGANLEDSIEEGMEVVVVRVREEILTQVKEVPFTTQTRKNSRLEKNVQNVIREGSNGKREIVTRIVYENGAEVSRETIGDTLLVSPIERIVEVGTIENVIISRGDVLRCSKVISMKASAYTASYEETGKKPGSAGFGITATGIKAKRGVIAVDPRVIPLGSRVYVETVGNKPDYGYAIAADTGGAIKGNVIDLFYENRIEALNWGRRDVKVYVLQN